MNPESTKSISKVNNSAPAPGILGRFWRSWQSVCSTSKDWGGRGGGGGVSFASPPDLHWVTILPAGYCHARHCSFCQGTQARGGEGNTGGAEEQDHGKRAAGSGQEICSRVRAGGRSHVSPAAVMQTDCRPTPEPNPAACWVKNSLPSLPTPFSARLFLTQHIYGAWFTAEPPPHCTHQDESTQKKKQQLHR